MSLSNLAQKRLFIIGPPGAGKSRTGNTLTNGNHFKYGRSLDRITTEVRIRSHPDGLMIGDMPGFDDAKDDDVFLLKFIERRAELEQRLPIDALLLVIKFEKHLGTKFLHSAKQFLRLFGTPSLKSLIILCIQGDEKEIYPDDDFEQVLRITDGYVHLKEKNEGRDIPFLLWDNIQPYPSQIQNLISCLRNRRQITQTEMGFIFQMVENELQKRREIRDTLKKQNKPIAPPQSWCNLQ
jgi:ABC-type dipeptide/oligopeptide/nickel transport system ATPase component